jgi:hypothetical protein
MDKIKRFIECHIPYYYCNLKCDYCYVIQGNYRNLEKLSLNYDLDTVKMATKAERFGGMCFFSICASGETLMTEHTVKIAAALLENGHFVNITNNGTMTKRIQELCRFPLEFKKRLLLSFSFHYLELMRLGLLDIFFKNVLSVKNAGISFFVQINLYDGYIPYIDEIKRLCKEKLNAYPQVPATRKVEKSGFIFHTTLSREKYMIAGRGFDSPLFEFTTKNFMRKQRGFCYAGDWSFVLNLATGELSRCYGTGNSQNIFDDPQKVINFRAVGNYCPALYCVNSSHFMSQGIIPAEETPAYAALRDRPGAGWFNEKAQELLNGKLYETNQQYTAMEKILTNLLVIAEHPFYLVPKPLKTVLRSIKRWLSSHPPPPPRTRNRFLFDNSCCGDTNYCNTVSIRREVA